MTVKRSDIHRWVPELSDREVHFIGMIFILWASLEHEVFMQTLVTFDAPAGQAPALPKGMNNLQFTEVLDLWKERVIALAKSRRAKVLQRQCDEMVRLKPYRDALAHGMWEWTPADLGGQINTTRVRRREVITTTFTADILGDFADKLAAINFKIRFPGGLIDLARAHAKDGGYISRKGFEMLFGAPR